MTIRSRILTAGLPLIIIISWVVLISVDSTRKFAALDPDAPQPNTVLHAVLVTALAVATLLGGIVGGVLFLRHFITGFITRIHAAVVRRLDALADTLATLAETQAQQADTLLAVQTKAEQTAKDARAVAALDDTVELRYLMAAPIVRATAPVLAGTALRAVALPSATSATAPTQTGTGRRRRRHRTRNQEPAAKVLPFEQPRQPKGETFDSNWRSYLAGIADQTFVGDREDDTGPVGPVG